MPKTPLDVLNDLTVASPCPTTWDQMTGDDRVRHCSFCDKPVYNLSAMTARDAIAFLNEREWRVCTQLFKRADGTVLTQDCPVGLRQRLRQRWQRVAGLAASLLAFVLSAGCSSEGDGRGDERVVPKTPSKQEAEFVNPPPPPGMPVPPPGWAPPPPPPPKVDGK